MRHKLATLFGAKARRREKLKESIAALHRLLFLLAMAVLQASVLQSFPFRAAVVALCVLLLPLIPSPQAPAAGGGDGEGGGGGQAFLAKVWELLHLLFVGIAVSYGLFSRKNDGGGRVAVDEKDAAAAPAVGKPDARYVSRMLQGELVFDDDDDDGLSDSPGGGARSWSALHHPEEPVVMVANGGGGRSHAQQAPLSLPVRALKPQPAQDSGAAGYSNGESRARPTRSGTAHDNVLPSPIPWRSRSGRLDAPSSTSPSPKRLSPAPSLSDETMAKASDEYAVPKRRSPYKSSISSPPPAPPPPPPPFPVHGYHPVAERRTVAKSFKEELQDHSMRGREDHYTQSFSNSSTYINSSPAKPRSSFDGSSSSTPSVGKSVRTIRPREGFQTQIQEQSDDRDAGDAPGNSHGSDSEEPYGYRAYQSISRFQYERGSSDPILGKVTVSSDETESSDDEEGVGAYSTRTNSPRESTPEVDENEVDKKAEEFIAKFREQIRLQRIESIKKSAGPRGVKHGK